MAPVAIKFVVSFSSQDPRYPADNLLTENENLYKKWMCAQNEKSGWLEGVFQLDGLCTFSGIHIGNSGCANIEIQVGKSSWPSSKEYVSLLPVATLMSPVDIRMWQNVNGVRMFKEADLRDLALKEKWDRIKVKCTQHQRKDKQFGLAMIRITAEDDSDKYPLMKMPLTPKQPSGYESRKQYNTTAKNNKYASPAWKSVAEFKNHFMKNVVDAEKKQSEPEKKIPSRERPPTFEEEVEEFIKNLDPSSLDLEKITLADLRHQLEKLKHRKLSKEEKKYFFQKMQQYLEKVFNDQDSKSTGQTPAKQKKTESKVEKTLKTPSANGEKSSKTPQSTSKSATKSFTSYNSYSSLATNDATPKSSNKPNGVGNRKTPELRVKYQGQENFVRSTPNPRTLTPKSFDFLSPTANKQQTPKSQAHTPVISENDSKSKPRKRKRKEPPPVFDTNDVWLSKETPPSQINQPRPKTVEISDDEDDVCVTSQTRTPGRGGFHSKLPSVLTSTPSGKTVARRKLPSTITSPRPAPGVKKNTPLYSPGMYSLERPDGTSYKSPSLEKSSVPSTENTVPSTESSRETHPSGIVCPLCNESFPWSDIEVHAAVCLGGSGSSGYSSNTSNSQGRSSTVDGVPCPLCGLQFPVLEIESHAERCSDFGGGFGQPLFL